MADMFGARVDHFGLLAVTHGAGTLDDIMSLVDSNNPPDADNRIDAADEHDDVIASAYSGAGDMKTAECVYSLNSGTLNLQDIVMGLIASGVALLTLNVTTGQNQPRPLIKLTGILGTIDSTAPTGKLNTFTLPTAVTIVGRMGAQPMGIIAAATTCKLQSSTFDAEVKSGRQDDGMGEPIAFGFAAGITTAGAEFVGITAAPSVTAQTGFVITQHPGGGQAQASWEKGSATAAGLPLVRGTAA
jgi:hypothetical protein